MIRLTELERRHDTQRIRLEGDLTAAGLQVLGSVLVDLRQRGVRRVVVEADGVVLVDRLAVRHWSTLAPEGVCLVLETRRRALFELLTSYGVEVDLVPEGDLPP